MSFFLNIDNHIENFFLAIRSPWGVDFFSAISWLGEWKLVVFLVILTLALFWLKDLPLHQLLQCLLWKKNLQSAPDLSLRDIFSFKSWCGGKKEYILSFLITVLGAEISGQLLKILFHRARPDGGLAVENTFSFPSGHALIAAAFYSFLIYYFWQTSKSNAQKYFYLISGLILILLIGLSRLYLGVHYFSDVIGGYILGAIWLAIGIYIHQKNSQTGKI